MLAPPFKVGKASTKIPPESRRDGTKAAACNAAKRFGPTAGVPAIHQDQDHEGLP
jgi:hypothetical protein